MVIVVSHISGDKHTWSLPGHHNIPQILNILRDKEGGLDHIILRHGARRLSVECEIPSDAVLVATLPLRGGKGGFGSMLRAIGAQIEKTTNREACRDLSGRRLRDINEEKRLKDFIAKKAEKEREALERKRKKFEELKSTPKHIFQDPEYYKQRETREKNLHDSIDKAFSSNTEATTSSSSRVKRSSEASSQTTSCKKKKRFLHDLDESSEDSEDNLENSDIDDDKEKADDNREKADIQIDNQKKEKLRTLMVDETVKNTSELNMESTSDVSVLAT